MPDLVVMAKGLGAGYAPLGAVLAPAARSTSWPALTGFNLSHTFNANPIACAAGVAVIDEVVDHDLMGNAERMGERLRAGLEGLKERSPLVGDVRGRGLLNGVELVADRETQRARSAPDVDPGDVAPRHATRHGILLYARRQNGGRFGDWSVIAPPLIVTEAEVDEIVERLGRPSTTPPQSCSRSAASPVAYPARRMSARFQRTLSPPYDGPPPPKGVGRRVLKLFRPYRFQIALAALAIVVTSALGVVNPFLVRAVFDKALFAPSGPDRLLVELTALMIVIPLISALIGVGQTYVTNVVGNRVMRDLRDRLFTHLQSMELRVLHLDKDRRDPVAARERCRRRPERRHEHSSSSDRRQRR